MTRRPPEEGFASRWSRRKRAAAEGRPEVDKGEKALAPAPETADAPEAEEKTDEELLEELGLPDPDRMKAGDDFAAFMSKAVPARLRNRALRRLWLSDPKLANLDMLVDHGEDYTDAALAVTNLQTGYEVGRGFVAKAAKAVAEAVDKAAGEGADEPIGAVAAPTDAQPEAESPPDDDRDRDSLEAPGASTASLAAESAPQGGRAPVRPAKSMRFTFEDD